MRNSYRFSIRELLALTTAAAAIIAISKYDHWWASAILAAGLATAIGRLAEFLIDRPSEKTNFWPIYSLFIYGAIFFVASVVLRFDAGFEAPAWMRIYGPRFGLLAMIFAIVLYPGIGGKTGLGVIALMTVASCIAGRLIVLGY